MARFDLTRHLLDWYDINRRSLPWRASPGAFAEPYHVWLSEIMLQQTTVKAVIPYFLKFVDMWPQVEDLAASPRDDVLKAWAGLGYYARARNLHACAIAVAGEHGGRFPQTAEALKNLPGIGDYTSAAIAAIAFGERAAVVDGNVERVIARIRAVETPLPKGKAAIRKIVDTITPADRPGDFAQGMMDLGATVCTPKSPDCEHCPLSPDCLARKAGRQTEFPFKAAKKAKPTRFGHVYVVRDSEGRFLLRQRSDKGLLGGMTEFPTSDWTEKGIHFGAGMPVEASWETAQNLVRHVFTHFALELTVHTATVSNKTAIDGHYWIAARDLDGEALPSVMRKVANVALER